MKKFRNYAEVKSAVDQISALESAIATEQNELVKSTLSEKAAALKEAFSVKPRGVKKPASDKAPKPAPAAKGK